MKKYTTTILLIISVFIAEAHSYTGKYAMLKQNWIWTIDRTMELQWNIKYLSDQINAVIYFVAMYFYTPNRVNISTVLSFIILCVIDFLMYLHNFKTLHYGSVYAWIVMLWGIMFFSPIIKVQINNLWKCITQNRIKR